MPSVSLSKQTQFSAPDMFRTTGRELNNGYGTKLNHKARREERRTISQFQN